MKEQQNKRRQLIKGLMLGVFGSTVGLLTKSEATASTSYNPVQKQAMDCWQQNYKEDPEQYLFSLNICSLNAKAIQKNEFADNHFVEFKGIYLAKSELAALTILEQAQEL